MSSVESVGVKKNSQVTEISETNIVVYSALQSGTEYM